MPAGLDGNPDPVRSPERDRVLVRIAGEIDALEEARVAVGIDGRAGSGKSTFADELAAVLAARGRTVVRSTIDSFHRPRVERHDPLLSPGEAYYRRSHDLDALRRELLDPFRGGEPYRVAWFDEPGDRRAESPPCEALSAGVLLFDGLFLQRPELRAYWSYSVFLQADARIRERIEAWNTTVDPATARRFEERYVRGWELYLAACRPAESARVVVDNGDFGAPRIL